MFNKLKPISFTLLLALLFINISCLTDEEKETRTIETELAELDDFLDLLIEKGYDIDTTDLGIYYIVNEEGEGLSPVAGDTVSVEYVGSFLNGSIFDASQDHWQEGIWEFVYLEQSLITGFNNALSVMSKGSEIDAIMASPFAYGITGSGSIPPYTTIIFNLKLNNIKPKSE